MEVLRRYERAKQAMREEVVKEMLNALRSPETVTGIAKILDEEIGRDGLQGNESLEVAQVIVRYLTTPQIIKPEDA